MRYVGDLITAERERTNHQDYTWDASTNKISAGISQAICLEFNNDAQDHLQAAILNKNPHLFVAEQTISLVAAQEIYAVSAQRVRRIRAVRYSFTGNSQDYEPLRPHTFQERQDWQGYPSFYIPYSETQILLNPIPATSQGTIKVAYHFELDDLDIRRGKVNGTPAGTIALTSTTAENDYFLGLADYVCISDKDGNVMARNCVVSSYVSPTITLAANISNYLVTGYTAANLANGYVTIGKNSTTHSKLADRCERYVKVYTQKRLLAKASSTDIAEEDEELLKMEQEILEDYAQPDSDVHEIPILDPWILL